MLNHLNIRHTASNSTTSFEATINYELPANKFVIKHGSDTVKISLSNIDRLDKYLDSLLQDEVAKECGVFSLGHEYLNDTLVVERNVETDDTWISIKDADGEITQTTAGIRKIIAAMRYMLEKQKK